MVRNRANSSIAALTLCVLSLSARAGTDDQTINFDYTLDVPAGSPRYVFHDETEKHSIPSQEQRTSVSSAPDAAALNASPAAPVPLPVALAPGLLGLLAVGIAKKYGRRIIT